MKKNSLKFKIYNFRLFFLIFLFTFLIFGTFFFLKNDFFSETKASRTDNISGWGWSENIGWMSLNNIDPRFAQNYGINLNDDNSITGHAWLGAGHGGWLVFGQSIITDVHNASPSVPAIHQKPGGLPGDPILLRPNTFAPDGANPRAWLDPATDKIYGWARFISLWDYGHNVMNHDDWGWVKLRRDAAPEYGLYLDRDRREINGYAWSDGGTASNNVFYPEAGYGWIHFSGVGLNEGAMFGYVFHDVNGNGIKDAGEQGLDGAVVVSSSGGYRSFSNVDGYYEMQGIRLDDTTGSFTSDFTASVENCTPLTINVTISGAKSQSFGLTCAGAPVGAQVEISGRIFEDVDNTGTYTSGDVAIAGGLVRTNRGNTAFSAPDGNYTLYKLSASLNPYSLAVSIPGYQVVTATKGYSINAPDLNVDFIVKRSKDYAVKSNLPWVQTMQGDVHARGGIFPSISAPYGYANATYMVTASGSIDRYFSYEKEFSSDQDVRKQDWVIEQYGGPLPDSLYGGVNIQSLIDDKDRTVGATSRPAEWFIQDGIYYKGGAPMGLEITGGEFPTNEKTVVIEGDLKITGDTIFVNGTFIKEDLPSIAFIVDGNIYIDQSVRHVVGTYYATGDFYDTDPTNPQTANKRLILEGLVVASNFHFDRKAIHDPGDAQYQNMIIGTQTVSNSYSDPEIMNKTGVIHFDADEFESPAALIFYDGRVMINTPPGLSGFSTGLPRIWREIPAM